MSTKSLQHPTYSGILRDLTKKFPYKVGFFSDCEGHYDVWQRYLRMALVLYIPEHSEVSNVHPSEDWRESLNSTSFATQQIRLKDDCHFIYGGDVCDRGNGDIRLLKDLIALKERYPERIHFILGNRDVNKLRLPTALHRNVIAHKPMAFWVKSPADDEEFLLNDRNEKMRWILKNTMGAPFSFECRRQELTELGLPHDDDSVTESYLSLVMPGGLLCKYLQYGKMSLVFEDTIFVHGALNDYYLGWVPPTYNLIKISKNSTPISSEVIPHPMEWVEKINRFAASEMQHYLQTIYDHLQEMDRMDSVEDITDLCWDIDGGTSGYGHRQPGSRLIQCGMGFMPDKSINPSIIYNSYLDNGKPIFISERVCAWLEAGELKNVIVGHQPNGDAPLLINNDYGRDKRIVVVSADTGYSKFVMYRRSDLMQYSDVCELHIDESLPTGQDNEWISYDAFMKKYHHDRHKATNCIGATATADTRNIYQVKDVNIGFYKETQMRHGRNSNSSRPQQAHFIVQGRLSQKSDYVFTLDDEPYIGRFTPSGWIIKARNIYFPHKGDTEHFLLGYSEKFDFKSKIVTLAELEAELNDRK